MPIGNVIFKNFVTKIKPEEKKRLERNTHMLFSMMR